MTKPIPHYSWSFSSLGLMNCPRKYELLRAKKILQSPPSAAGDEGTRIHALIEDYFKEDKWDDELLKYKRLLTAYKTKGGEAEKEYAFKWVDKDEYAPFNEEDICLYDHYREQYLVQCKMDDPKAWFRAILDWVKIEEELKTAETADWKTGRVRPSKQLQLYAWIIFLVHKKVDRVKGVFHWINHNDQLPQWFDRKDMDKLFEPFQEILDQIDRCYAADVWPEVPGEVDKYTKRGQHCRFCPATPEHCSQGKY